MIKSVQSNEGFKPATATRKYFEENLLLPAYGGGHKGNGQSPSGTKKRLKKRRTQTRPKKSASLTGLRRATILAYVARVLEPAFGAHLGQEIADSMGDEVIGKIRALPNLRRKLSRHGAE